MGTEAPPQPTSERIGTGIRGVDLILGGGFMPGSVQLIVGRPGSGKTIFANQVAFHHAAAGFNAVYVTLLAESHARMLTHLACFSFFNPELVSRRIVYMSGHSVLEQAGLDGLLDLLTRTIRENSASLLVIDGLNTAKEFAPTTTSFKRFLLRLATSASLTSCTTLLLSLLTPVAEAEPETGTVDGILRLDKRVHGARVVRELTVEKMRGTSYALGMHTLEIDIHGVHGYPRIESLPLPANPLQTLPARRLTFDIKGLDATLGGGVLERSTTLLFGPPGTGKTLLGSSFLASGLERHERALYVGLREPPERMIHQADGIGLSLSKSQTRGCLETLWFPAIETSVDAIAWTIFDRVEQRGIKRVFIDGIDGFSSMIVYPERLPRFYTALLARLTSLGCTTVLAESAPAPIRESMALGPANNVVVVSEQIRSGRICRYVIAQKVQAGPHDYSPRRLHVSSRGLSVDSCRWRRLFREDKP